MITKETTKRAAKILAEQKKEYARSFEAAKGNSKAIAKAAADYRAEYGKTPKKRWANALSQAAKETATHERPRRKTADAPATKPKAATPVAKPAAPKPVVIPASKALPTPKFKLPVYILLKGLKPTDSNMVKLDKTEIRDGKVYYLGRYVDAKPNAPYRHIPEDMLIADYNRVPRLTAEKAIREKWTAWHEESPKAAKRAASKSVTGKKGVDKLEVRRQLIKLGVIEGSGQSVHFTPKLKELIKLYPGHKQEVLEVACNMWAGDTIRRRGGGIVEHYKEEAIKEARRVLASHKTTATSKTTTGKNPAIKLRKFYQVTGTLFSGYNAGTEVDIILSEVLFSDYFYIEKILVSNNERSYYGISATGKVFSSNSGCTKSDVEKKIRYGKSILTHCHKRGEWDLEVIPERSWYGPEYFRTLDDADRYAKRVEKLCGYKTKRIEFLITQKHVDEVMEKFSDNK